VIDSNGFYHYHLTKVSVQVQVDSYWINEMCANIQYENEVTGPVGLLKLGLKCLIGFQLTFIIQLKLLLEWQKANGNTCLLLAFLEVEDMIAMLASILNRIDVACFEGSSLESTLASK
jgi:hypothetical protein